MLVLQINAEFLSLIRVLFVTLNCKDNSLYHVPALTISALSKGDFIRLPYFENAPVKAAFALDTCYVLLYRCNK